MREGDNLQKLTQFSTRSLPKHLVGKQDYTKDTIKDITIDSQVNSNFPYWWSPASLIFNDYFYLFLYLYMIRRTIKNTTLHLRSLKNRNRRSAFGRPAIKFRGAQGGRIQLVNGRPTLALSVSLFILMAIDLFEGPQYYVRSLYFFLNVTDTQDLLSTLLELMILFPR